MTDFIPIRTYEIGDRRIHVYDQIFPPDTVRNVATVIAQLNFQRHKSFDNELNTVIDGEKFRKAPFLWPVTEGLFKQAGRGAFNITDTSTGFSHAYAAAMGPGSCATVHQDIDSAESVTFLYYANLVWRGKWGGETIFYDNNIEAAVAVTPRPGRLVMFHSNIFHRAGIPHPDTPTYRYTVSVFYYPKKKAVEESTERAGVLPAQDQPVDEGVTE